MTTRSINLSEPDIIKLLDGVLTHIDKDARRKYTVGDTLKVKESVWLGQNGEIVHAADNDKPGKGWLFKPSWYAPAESTRFWLNVTGEDGDKWLVEQCGKPSGEPESKKSIQARVDELERVVRELQRKIKEMTR